MNFTDLNLTKKGLLKVKNTTISGVTHPYLIVEFVGFHDDDTFLVFGDNKELDFFSKKLSGDGEIQVELKIPNHCSSVKIVCTRNNEYSLEKAISLSFIIRCKIIIKKIVSVCTRSIIVVGRGIRFLWREHHFLIPPSLFKKYFKQFFTRVKERGEILWNPFIQTDYLKWIQEFEIDPIYKQQEYQPLLSILVPVYNVSGKLLEECITSVLNQTYKNFEICIVDDCSTKQETVDMLKQLMKIDNRIQVSFRKENGHISVATNDALAMAKGEFVCLLDNDDVLHKDALYENVVALNMDKTLDFIYSDEDKLDFKGNRCEPHFKSDYAPDTLLGINYICHFAVLRKTIVEEVGGFSIGLEGVQDHDLFLKVTEKTKKIHHIPKVLYHWRMVAGSTSVTIGNKNYAVEKGERAIQNALQRRGTTGTVKSIDNSTVYLVEYQYTVEPSVSIIIPIRDQAEVTEKCLVSLYNKTEYSNFDVIIMDNNSVEDKTKQLLKEYQQKYNNFKVIKADMEFNYSKINNLGVSHTQSDVIVLLNNDTEVISPNWLSTLVGYAIQKGTGAVGPKLLYPDQTIQHGGVLIGLGGAVAAHAYIGHPRDDRGMFGRLLIPHNYSAVTAACLVIERKKYLEVGGLEESLKVAYNDIDFNLKLLSIGYYNLFVPQVELFHYESKSRGLDSTSEKYNQFLKESNFMNNKWKKYIQEDPFYNINFSRKGVYMLDREKRSHDDEI